MVTTSDPGGSVGRVEQRVEFSVVQERDERLVKALGRDREIGLDGDACSVTLPRIRTATDRCEPGVAGADSLRVFVLEMVENAPISGASRSSISAGSAACWCAARRTRAASSRSSIGRDGAGWRVAADQPVGKKPWSVGASSVIEHRPRSARDAQRRLRAFRAPANPSWSTRD